MVKLFHSAATMNIETRQRGLVLSLSLVTWQLLAANLVYGAAGIVADNYNSATTGVGDRTYSGSGGQYASTKDNAVANTLADYLKGFSGSGGRSGSGVIGMNDFGQRHDQQQESIGYHPISYGSNQNRYGNSGSSGSGGGGSSSSSNEQQSHISAGYQPRIYHQSPVSEESEHSYEVPHHHQHQSDIDKFRENNFSHQYGQESSENTDGGGSDGYYSASGNEGSSSIDYHQNHPELTTSQHQHTDVINYVPYPVVKKVHIPYAKPVQIPVSNAILVPIRRPVPIHIPITKQIQVPVERELKIPVEKLVPYPVEKHVPVPVEKHVPYEVVKYVPVKVPKPYAVKVPVVKTVVHKIKQWW
ncbi:uncharacterized protein LOC129942023 [Eupeodes corollae]|uniref:uncharacterized protein LOC129942023 n=1 Tax=Eupeodes corollae TaxID=290404 RepID=UPI0024929223|nr:uncharacterized protein LOC129942023 [Eupeodes corollae]